MPIALLIGPLRAPRKACGFGEVELNMLHKDHIYVVQGYKSYTCLIKFNNIYIFFKNVHMLFKKIFFL